MNVLTLQKESATPADCTIEQITPDEIEAAAFRREYPAYERTRVLDDLRARDYARLDEQGQIYLDYTGGSLYAESQLRAHMDLLRGVFGNPHSTNPTSHASTVLMERARSHVLRFFNASLDEYGSDEYEVIFTPNASGALKLVGESYPFATGSRYLLTADNHNSVNGIREFARARGAQVDYLPLVAPELRADETKLAQRLAQATPGRPNLFAYPAQSNFSGVQHPLEWVEQARSLGWDVLIDCAAFAPTNRLDLSRVRPDFVSLSFYKIFGYPTGVGCLIARKQALAKLRRPWFAGGTIRIAAVQGNGGHYLREGFEGFEDGTVSYLSLPAVEIGLRHVESIGIETIHERVRCLTGRLLQQMAALRHANGSPLVRIYGPTNLERRGGTIAFNLYDPDRRYFDYREVEPLASEANISLRSGCFCNPGAGEAAHGITRQEIDACFRPGAPMSYEEYFAYVQKSRGTEISALRISVGLASNFTDTVRFIAFLRSFLNRPARPVGDATCEACDS